MTLIASFAVQQCPVLFGDLLITGEVAQNDTNITAVPAIGEVTEFFGDSGWAVAGLSQKLVLISPECAIAWAGSWIGARSVVADLREMVKAQRLTADSIREYLEHNEDLVRHPVSILGWTLEPEGLRSFWYGADDVFQSAALGTAVAAGSGHPVLRDLSALLGDVHFEATGNVGPVQSAISVSAILASTLIRAEFFGGDRAPTLLNMFGGGYESIVFFDGRFSKVNDITFLIWEARPTGGGVAISLPLLVVKQHYCGDVLLLRSARTGIKDGGATLVDEQRHVVLPMYGVPKDQLTEKAIATSFQSDIFCHLFAVPDGDGVMFYAQITKHGTEEAVVRFTDTDRGITLSLRDDFLRGVADSIEAGLKESPNEHSHG